MQCQGEEKSVLQLAKQNCFSIESIPSSPVGMVMMPNNNNNGTSRGADAEQWVNEYLTMLRDRVDREDHRLVQSNKGLPAHLLLKELGSIDQEIHDLVERLLMQLRDRDDADDGQQSVVGAYMMLLRERVVGILRSYSITPFKSLDEAKKEMIEAFRCKSREVEEVTEFIKICTDPATVVELLDEAVQCQREVVLILQKHLEHTARAKEFVDSKFRKAKVQLQAMQSRYSDELREIEFVRGEFSRLDDEDATWDKLQELADMNAKSVGTCAGVMTVIGIAADRLQEVYQSSMAWCQAKWKSECDTLEQLQAERKNQSALTLGKLEKSKKELLERFLVIDECKVDALRSGTVGDFKKFAQEAMDICKQVESISNVGKSIRDQIKS
eukprot:TRINITY_DN3809_c0_g1_i2.p1 TRINITY_DN3809_c0_g1~~TRINITY_DN3809_c0_g1_i2.p1  ORF type:complete len:384 (-),score=104.37 TRINITY_DN3809_c0_g1_i2:21-1172(-)